MCVSGNVKTRKSKFLFLFTLCLQNQILFAFEKKRDVFSISVDETMNFKELQIIEYAIILFSVMQNASKISFNIIKQHALNSFNNHTEMQTVN